MAKPFPRQLKHCSPNKKAPGSRIILHETFVVSCNPGTGFFMPIDIITLVLLVMAIWKGYSRGLIVALFSFIGVIIGLAAALKCSVLVADWLNTKTDISNTWLPFVSFGLVIVVVILLLRAAANLIEAALDVVLLGWLNKAGGILLYMAGYMLVYSVVLFYITEMGLLKPETIADSQTYAHIAPRAPQIINGLGYLIPFFKDMFTQLQDFFGAFADAAQ